MIVQNKPSVNIFSECKSMDLPLWQCPSFLFLLNGAVTILAMMATYLVATKYTDPEIVALMVTAVAAVLFIVGYLVTKSFEQLAEANRLKSEFVSIASHQLRTPLTGIKWTINLIMKHCPEGLGKEQMERLKNIQENNQRMINLVNDLLNVSRIEQGRIVLKPERMSLKTVAQDLSKEYEQLAKASNIKLTLIEKKAIPLIFSDRQALSLVLHNLVDNAIRYTKGGGEVKIKLSKRKRKGKEIVRCEVVDNGVGIPKKEQKKVFQKFFRSQNVLKYQTEGTGLGLFIAQAFINTAKGKIGFHSQENKGTTFWFEIPIKI